MKPDATEQEICDLIPKMQSNEIALPYMSFWVGDWLASEAVSSMDIAAEGAYHRLLCMAWRSSDCGIPADDNALANLSKLFTDWPDRADIIRAQFVEVNGRLYNLRLMRERYNAQKKYKIASKAGKASGKSRREKARKQSGSNARSNARSTDVERTLNYTESETESEPYSYGVNHRSDPLRVGGIIPNMDQKGFKLGGYPGMDDEALVDACCRWESDPEAKRGLWRSRVSALKDDKLHILWDALTALDKRSAADDLPDNPARWLNWETKPKGE